MRIAFCHNLKTSDAIEEAEFDTAETIERLTRALESGGHEVHPVNLNHGVAGAVARLEALRPELIFNTAEGKPGRLREAFYPALFEQLGIPFTGADAWSCALTLDKQATKERVTAEGVPAPRAVQLSARTWRERLRPLRGLAFPVIAKPNFEGSSIGISPESVIDSFAALERAIPRLLESFPLGILVEEFIAGRDVTVGFLEALEPPVLEPTGYRYLNTAENPHNIYDYRLKNAESDRVEVLLDPGLEPALAERIREWTAIAARVLEVRDVARFDYRVSPDGRAWFLEANALPSLEDGAGLLLAAGRRGLSFEETILKIIESAARRHGIQEGAGAAKGMTDRQPPGRPAGKAAARRIGLTFNLKRSSTETDDTEAEFDSPRTIAALRGALEGMGWDVVEVEALPDLPARLEEARVDLVFNIAEGRSGRNRESHVPSLCEFLGIPHTGSDAATLAIALDKALAKRLLRDAGVPTPGFVLMTTGAEELPRGLRYPLIAKPNAEGTSKGLGEESVVEDEQGLRFLVQRLLERYRQPVIVEEYFSGREVTAGLVGWPRPRMLEPMEVVFLDRGVKHPVYHYRLKQDFTEHTRFECPARLSPAERDAVERTARAAFEALGCLDVARIDLRLDGSGEPGVIEVNPLPGLAPGFSDLCLIAQGSGLSYGELLREILHGALARTGLAAPREVSHG